MPEPSPRGKGDLAPSGAETGFTEIDVPREDILPTPLQACRSAGYPEGGVPDYFLRVAESAIDEATRLCSPRAGYALFESIPLPAERTVRLGGVPLMTGKIIAEELAGVERAAVFLCTLGSGPEERVRELLEADEGPEAFIMDAVASLMAENAAEAVHAAVEAEARGGGWGVTERYSPGYCGWPVSDQKALLSLLPAGACGITLSESCLMHPVKSVSGIIGAGPGAERRGYRCAICGRMDCPYRNQTH